MGSSWSVQSARTRVGRPRPARVTISRHSASTGTLGPSRARRGTGVVRIGFAGRTCLACPTRSLCPRAEAAPREVTFRQPGRHEGHPGCTGTAGHAGMAGALQGARWDRGLPVAVRVLLVLCRLGENPPAARRDRGSPGRRAAQRVGAGRSTRNGTDPAPGPPHGRLNRAGRVSTKGISNGAGRSTRLIGVMTGCRSPLVQPPRRRIGCIVRRGIERDWRPSRAAMDGVDDPLEQRQAP